MLPACIAWPGLSVTLLVLADQVCQARCVLWLSRFDSHHLYCLIRFCLILRLHLSESEMFVWHSACIAWRGLSDAACIAWKGLSDTFPVVLFGWLDYWGPFSITTWHRCVWKVHVHCVVDGSVPVGLILSEIEALQHTYLHVFLIIIISNLQLDMYCLTLWVERYLAQNYMYWLDDNDICSFLLGTFVLLNILSFLCIWMAKWHFWNYWMIENCTILNVWVVGHCWKSVVLNKKKLKQKGLHLLHV